MKKSGKLFLVSIALAAIVMVISVSFQVKPVNVTGTWNLVVETGQGSGTPVFVLKHENDTLLTGTYTGQFGESPVKGSIKANKIVLKLSVSEIDIVYSGIVDGNNVKGTVVFGTMGEGTFTGTKKVN